MPDGRWAGDRALTALASRQHGVVARGQLVGLGLSRRAIERRLAAGRLHCIHTGAYAVGHRALGAHARWLAAVLSSGPGALLSHRSAAALWGFRSTAATDVDVTVLGSGRRNRPGIAVHVTRELHERDRREHAGVPVTSVARTLLDLAEVVPERQLRRAVEEAERLQLLDLRAVEDVCRRGRGRRGLGVLRAALADQSGPQAHTRSELERFFLGFCHEHRLPPPRVNALVVGYEVDALWAPERLIVELDGFAFHRTRAAFERDRLRDADLQLGGYRVLRLTDRRLRRDPAAVAEALRAMIGAVPLPACG